jgi:hypothetical protein
MSKIVLIYVQQKVLLPVLLIALPSEDKVNKKEFITEEKKMTYSPIHHRLLIRKHALDESLSSAIV